MSLGSYPLASLPLAGTSGGPLGLDGVRLFIAGVDRTGFITKESLRIQESLNSRAVMSFAMVDTAGAYLPTEGEAVEWRNEGEIIFAGSIDKVAWSSDFTTGRFLSCQCVSKALALDRRLVARAFVSMTTDDIIREVIDDYLAEDGISAGQLDAGPVLTKAVFNYRKASGVMDDICDLTGYSWYVDQYGQLHVRNRSTLAAPWNISDVSAPIAAFKASRSRQNYSNRQWLRAGQGTTDERIENFKGDDERQTFTLKFPVSEVPSEITVNAVSKTIGIRQLDTGKDFYWQKGDPQITQDDAGTPLTTTDVLAVTYTGFYPLIVRVQNDAEIIDRISIEGGSGLYERIDSDESIEDQDLAQDKASGLLRKFGSIQESVTYTAYDFGLRAGQLQNIVQTDEAVSGDFLIADVTIVWSVPRNGYVVQVKALSGEQLGGWQAFFRALFASSNKFTLRENEVVLQAISESENLIFTDEMARLSYPTIEALVVGGGAAGAGKTGGGGGAGGMLSATDLSLTDLSYPVVVGTGGVGVSLDRGGNGGLSSFATLTALGGGSGGVNNAGDEDGRAGGSGGGAANAGAIGAGNSGQGSNGGLGGGEGGGGGGAGAVGSAGVGGVSGGAGGAGVASSISGSSVTYGGGGGGGSFAGTPGTGGSGGGGNAGTSPTAGTANRGGGGGGTCGNGANPGGDGGSGVVIIRYLTPSGGDGTGGTITHSGGYTIHTFTSSGTFTMPAGEGDGDNLSNGSDDPLTTARVSDATQAVGHQFRVGASRVGRDYFS